MSETINVLTAEQLAEKLGVHVKTIYRNQEIPRLEISKGVVRYDEATVAVWLRSKMSRKPIPKKRKPKVMPDEKVTNFIRHKADSQESA
jgi:IS30 family transposase